MRSRRKPESRVPVREEQPNIHGAFAALLSRQERVEKAFDANAEVYSSILSQLDVKSAVLQRVMNDLFGKRPVYTDESGSELDFNAYAREYLVCEAFAEFAQKLAAFNPEPSRVVLAPDEADPIVFGGGG